MANVSSSNGLDKRPKLRFPGFDEAYRTTHLGEIATLVNRTDPKSNAPIMMLSAGNGFIMQSVKYSRDNAGQSLKKYILLNQGELAYNHGASKAKQFGCCYELTEPEARIPYVYHCFKVSDTEYTPFVAATLNNPKMDKQLKRLVSSSVRMDGLLNISFDDYMSVSLHLPSFAEQKKIADFLKKLDERITAQEMLMTSLKKYKRGLLRSYFMTDEWNTHSKWDKCKLGPCCSKIGSGKTPRGGSSVYVDHGVTFLRSQNVLWGTLDLNDVSYIDEETNNTMLSSEVRCGDVLLNITGASIGRSCIYSLDERANVNQHVCILRLSQEGKERLLPEFLLQQILSDRIQQQVMDCQNGGSREGLNFQQISDFNIVIPDMREQRKICGMLNAFDQRVSCEETALHTLLDLRAALMQQLFI